MDSLIELIDNRIDKALSKSAHVNSLIGQVVATSNDKFTVRLLTTGTIYSLPNYSGSDINIGEQVYVYYSGGLLSNQTAYIGAVLTKPTALTYIYATNFLKELSSTAKKVSALYFVNTAPTTINLVFNAVIESATSDTVTFTIYIDNEAYDYAPTMTVNDGYTHCNFVLPLVFDGASEHDVAIKATGVGEITKINAYIFGTSITESEWVLTTENDYIYVIRDDEATLLKYIGAYKRIITPLTIEDNPVTAIYNTCFMNSAVEAVIISSGVETIG